MSYLVDIEYLEVAIQALAEEFPEDAEMIQKYGVAILNVAVLTQKKAEKEDH
jgi:hypothetical protein